MPVYLIRAGDIGPIKIGWAKDAEARRRQLQVSHPEPLRMIRTIEGTRKIERWLHARYFAYRLVGEWFRFDADMLVVEPPDLGPVEPNWRARKAAMQAKKAALIAAPKDAWAADRCSKQQPCPQCVASGGWERAQRAFFRPGLAAE